MSRYTGWHPRRGEVAPPSELVDLGKTLLGELQNRIRLGGPPSLVIRRNTAAGFVEARMVKGQPQVFIQARRRPEPDVAGLLEGFVTWPTNSAGTTAYADSWRVVLESTSFRAIRELEYLGVLPEGLNIAGNVDWRGADGWVVSWYGPRARYIDFQYVRAPVVYFKGQVIFDLGEIYGGDAHVRGAAITTVNDQPWLVVMARFSTSNLCLCLRILEGGPTSAGLVMDSYDNVVVAWDEPWNADENFRDGAGHPWFFNPAGTEARTMHLIGFRASAERIFTLTFPGGVPSGAHSYIEHSTVSEVHEGYTLGEGQMHTWTIGQTRVTVDIPSPPAPDYDGWVSASISSALIADAQPLGPSGLPEWQYKNSETCAEPWVKIAVDYNAAGELVYAYGEYPTFEEVENGTWTEAYDHYHFDINHTLDGGKVFFSDGEATMYAVLESSGTTWSPASNAGQETADWTNTRIGSNGGLRVGDLTIPAPTWETTTFTGTWDFSVSGFNNAGAPVNDEYIRDAGLGEGPEAVIELGWMGGTNSNHVVCSETMTSEDRQVQIIFMDLRCEAVFVGTFIDERTKTREVDVNFRGAGLSDRIFAVTWEVNQFYHLTDRSGSILNEEVGREKLHIEGWVRGTKVFDYLHDGGVYLSQSQEIDWGETEPGSETNVDAIWTSRMQYGNNRMGNMGSGPEWQPDAWPSTTYGDWNYSGTEGVTIHTPASLLPAPTPAGHEYELKNTYDVSSMWVVLELVVTYNAGVRPGVVGIDYLQNDWYFKVHLDWNDVVHYGSFCWAGDAWIVSMPLPSPLGGPFGYANLSSGGLVLPMVGGGSAVHAYPIWYLAPTTRPTPTP